MKIINLTPHDVVLDNGYVHITFPPSGNIARLDQITERTLLEYIVTPEAIIKLPLHQAPQVRVTNLPKQKEGTYYIVSSYVAQAIRRKDLLAPLSDSTAVRDDLGRVISVKMFQQYVEQEILEVHDI